MSGGLVAAGTTKGSGQKIPSPPHTSRGPSHCGGCTFVSFIDPNDRRARTRLPLPVSCLPH